MSLLPGVYDRESTASAIAAHYGWDNPTTHSGLRWQYDLEYHLALIEKAGFVLAVPDPDGFIPNPDNETDPNPWDLLQTADGLDWQTMVANGDTVLGLMDWIDHNRK